MEQFRANIRQLFSGGNPNHESVKALMSSFSFTKKEWEEYAKFDPGVKYVLPQLQLYYSYMYIAILIMHVYIAILEILLMMVAKRVATICLFSAGILKKAALFMTTMSPHVFLKCWAVDLRRLSMKCQRKESNLR